MRSIISIFLFLFATAYVDVYAQYNSSPAGEFTVNQFQGCTPLTVIITAPACDGSKSCTVIPGDSSPNKPITSTTQTFTYTQPGTYTLTLFIQSAQSTIQIKVLPNTQPDFEIYSCSMNKVSLKITDAKYENYQVDYPNPPGTTKFLLSGQTDIQTLSPGSQNISVKGINSNADNTNCLTNTQAVIAQPSLPTLDISQLTVASTTSIKLDFPLLANQQNVLYKLKVATNNNSSFQQVTDLHKQNSIVLSNFITPDKNYYCFQMIPFDFCTNSTAPPSVNIICSATFDVVAESNRNKLSWKTSPPDNNYAITKNPGSPILYSAASPTPYYDQPVTCGIDYTYQLISNYLYGGKSFSLPKTVSAFSSTVPPAIENITSVVNPTGTSVSLTWEPGSQSKKYWIYRSPGAASPLDTLTTEQFTDDGYKTEKDYCYKIKYVNNCGIESPESTVACPLRLSGILKKNNNVDLSWNGYTGWTDGVNQYTIQRNPTIIPPPSLAGTQTTYSDTEASQDLDNQVYEYTIVANDVKTGIQQSVSNTVIIIKEPNIFYPTAFTPDSRGPLENEVFKVFGRYVNLFEMKIFNRWGELMYTTKDISQGWDGSYHGSPMPEGTYAFIANLTDEAGRTFIRSGSVLLLRKN